MPRASSPGEISAVPDKQEAVALTGFMVNKLIKLLIQISAQIYNSGFSSTRQYFLHYTFSFVFNRFLNNFQVFYFLNSSEIYMYDTVCTYT